ncbi:MAG: N-6 DNA methylase [Planctomycetes bacterium]|nr:N-6 DNA methylase [Planctomycetota bacterium]
MSVPQELLELVERFNTNREAYRSGQYNETQLRREFIDPFFQLLGWDVNNEKGYAEAYKDVIHEDSIKIGGLTKAPDYCFRIGGVRKFFVETKRPSVNIKEDIDPAFQLRRYAWSAKLPLSILTDFEEFAVYDCRVKPSKTDKASTARIMYVGNCAEFTQHWDEIASIFSRDAVLKGSFDRYAESSKAKKGTAEVDTAFLKEIESWRDALARNLALRNPDLSQHDLNFAVQRTIDRIIFLRICEDRGIERYGQLMALQNGDRMYERLCELFYRADERYNSGLFHFQKEKDRSESPDTLTPNLTIDDGALKDIIKNLYYPDSPYEFSVLSADILGQVYEQFLGKVIRLTAGHRAVVEEKPEVRKAGGIYYTPTYIVDYIVKNTVGKLVRAENFQPLRKTIPKEISKIRILDPACGSGSFLLGAYQYLLDWHRDWYIANGPEKWATGRSPALYQAQTTLPSVGGQGGVWRLTTAERRRILLNNIYGVDIDPQAVEVTKLSLLLKVLEGESEQTIVKQLKMFHERALPDLGNNIKCGNSLIGTDFYNTPLTPLFRGEKMDSPLARGAGGVSDEERYRINPFDWEKEFPEIIKPAPAGREQGAGGFDAVIGNPPYIPIEMMSESQKAYFQQKHHQLERKYDSSIVFILALLQKLKPSGRLGFISSIAWQTGENFAKLREHLFTKVGILNLINLPFDVFKDAYVDTGIYILSGKPVNTYSIYRFPKKEKFPDINNVVFTEVPIRLISPPDFKVILEPRSQKILSRILEDKRFV